MAESKAKPDATKQQSTERQHELKSTANPENIPPDYGTVAHGVHILGGLGNALTVELGDSVLQIDTGNNADMANKMIASLQKITHDPVTTIAFSHGHLGYNFALALWLEAAKTAGHPPPAIVAQENALQLIEQYLHTTPLMKLLLALQFDMELPSGSQPLPLTRPTATFNDGHTVYGSQRHVQLLSAPSETPGAIAAWIPDVEVLYAGPSCIPLLPNAGMPLWPTGDVRIWADTLDRLARMQPKTLVRSYGKVIYGADEIQNYLSTTARALRYIHTAVIEKLNEGVNLNTALNTIEYPWDLFDHPFLASSYGSTSDIVRQVWYSITGWWDRNPTNLVSLPEQEAAAATAAAITDHKAVIEHANTLREQGKRELALHVIDLVALAPSGKHVKQARKIKAELCAELADSCENFAIKSLYASSAKILADSPSVISGVR